MLSREDNDRLCRVAPGTVMGDLLRRYWIPVLTSDELPAPDSPPMRVKLLGEDLVAFRVTSGKIGLIQAACPHRGASLFLGRNEAEGLRCVYHGWKFDVGGACVDIPNEPIERRFHAKVCATAYPCVERNGIVWTYMGPPELQPELPQLTANMTTGPTPLRIVRECNWIQALEGDLDASHLAFAHRRLDYEPDGYGKYMLQGAPEFEVVDTEFGLTAGAYYPAEPDTHYWRISHHLFPFYAMVAGGRLGEEDVVRAWVPLDDEHTLFWQIPPHWRTMTPGDTTSGLQGGGFQFVPATSDPLGRFRLAANKSNDYLIDREFQRERSFTGIHAPAPVEDQAITESMGTIVDRSQEHLGPSDRVIIAMRRRLLAAAKAMRERGVTPPGVDSPGSYRVRSGAIVLPRTADWLEATEALRWPAD